MILYKANYRQKIAGLSLNDWKPLLELIPEIILSSSFCHVNKDRFKKGAINLDSSIHEAGIVHKFRNLVYEIPIIIDFDWARWDEGKKMVSDEGFDYESIDIPTKCKIITAIVRNDRFSSGRLASAFKSGLILKNLVAIESQLYHATLSP